MNKYYEIQYRTKEDAEAWFPSGLVPNNKYASYEEACEDTRQLVYEERIKARKDRSRLVVEYRVVEQLHTYEEKSVKVFPIQESIFV